jgi:hypothetical protein
VLGVTVHAVHAALRRVEHAPPHRGRRTVVPRATLEARLDRRARGVSEQTSAHYVKALVQLGNWLVSSKRAGTNLFAALSRPKVVENRRRRRVLDSGEVRRLVAAAGASPRSFRGLSGTDRAILYATAYYTAFRSGGLASLTPECFDLDGPVPAVTLPVRRDKGDGGLVNAMPPTSSRRSGPGSGASPEARPSGPDRGPPRSSPRRCCAPTSRRPASPTRSKGRTAPSSPTSTR